QRCSATTHTNVARTKWHWNRIESDHILHPFPHEFAQPSKSNPLIAVSVHDSQ
ncbi:unnamed protein product, partial [Musa hybrid cultivar]